MEEMPLYIHIDNRLIHGQVTVTWCSYYEAQRIVVADDKVAADPIQRTVLPMAARGLPTAVLSVADAVTTLKSHEPSRERVLVIARNVHDALGLVRGGITVESINVGNQSPVPGTKYTMILPWSAVTDDDVRDYAELASMGLKVTVRRYPTERAQGIIELLKKIKLL
jgi:mannose/fructose/N-acetylgalactosamine-specific phosphotransferase system component IIB